MTSTSTHIVGGLETGCGPRLQSVPKGFIAFLEFVPNIYRWQVVRVGDIVRVEEGLKQGRCPTKPEDHGVGTVRPMCEPEVRIFVSGALPAVITVETATLQQVLDAIEAAGAPGRFVDAAGGTA
jgi:hypothetical protein